MSIFERNSMIYLCLITVSVYLALHVNILLLLIWPSFLIIEDILYFRLGKSILDTEIAVQRGYQFGYIFLDDQSGDGRDLGFNLYDGDLSKSRKQSQQDKWDFVLRELGLQPGDSLIDVGCGYGDWLNYAKSKGINVVGVNISPEQSDYCRKHYGIEVICNNWKNIPGSPELEKKLYEQFDAVTFMDTIEHYVPSKYRKDFDMQGCIYENMFEMAYHLLKPNSKSNRIFISCIHMLAKDKKPKDLFKSYLQIRFHSGYYPIGDNTLVNYSTKYFSEIARYDKTEDYRLTSVLDDKHFGKY